MSEVKDSAVVDPNAIGKMPAAFAGKGNENEQEDAKKSFSWNPFQMLPSERKTIFYMCLMFSSISFTYTFLRNFKDRIIFSVLDNVESKNWLKLFTFLATQFLVTVAQNISSKSNFNTAFTKLTMLFGSLLLLNTLCMTFSYYIQLDELYTDFLFVSNSLSIRGLRFLYPFFLILNQWTYSFFYILAEVIGSMMVSFCFMTYVNSNTTENQNRRFVKILYIFSNITSFIAAEFYSRWNVAFKKRSKEDADFYYTIFPCIAVAIYVFVLGIKTLLEKELQKNAVASSTSTTKKAGSKKKKIGFSDSIYLMFNSNLLLCMSALSLFYNISSNLLETAGSSGMKASASYLGHDRSFYSTGYKSLDGKVTSFGTCIIIASPMSFLIDKYGIETFAYVPLAVVAAAVFIQGAFAIINYPATGNECMWPFSKFVFEKFYPEVESWVSTGVQISIKISKYAFFDIVKEALSMKIDPSIRPLFKGVFDGSMAKFGKCAGSIYGIIMAIFIDCFDNRYYFPITGAIMLGFCICWHFAIRYLSKSYNLACKTSTFMDPDMKEKINL